MCASVVDFQSATAEIRRGKKKRRKKTEEQRHTASTSMYSLTFRVRVATSAQYGRNGTASLQITSHTQQARRFYRSCVRRALGLADYRWALTRISIM